MQSRVLHSCGDAEKTLALLIAIDSICMARKYDGVTLRRWGSGKLKPRKLIVLIKRVDPVIYHELFNYFNCREGDDACLGKAVFSYLRTKFKSILEEIVRVGDLCEHLYPELRRRVRI